MTDWIDFVVYAAFTVTLWFVIPAGNSRFVLPLVADRDPNWLSSNPAAARRLEDSRWFRRTSTALGALVLAALLGVQLGVWPEALSAPVFEPVRWMVLTNVTVASVLIWLAFSVVCGALFNRWLETHVPLAERRRATLERRSIDAYVPRSFRLAVYAIVLAHLGLWLTVGMLMDALDVRASREFWAMFAFQAAIALICFLIVRGIALRRPHAMDRVFGPGFRRTEVRLAFGSQLLPLMNGLARLYEQAGGTVPADVNRVSQLALVAIMLLGVGVFYVRFGRWPDAGLDPGTMTPTRSAHVSVVVFMLVTQGVVETL